MWVMSNGRAKLLYGDIKPQMKSRLQYEMEFI